MRKPYIVCRMMTSVGGCMDCDTAVETERSEDPDNGKRTGNGGTGVFKETCRKRRKYMKQERYGSGMHLREVMI